MECDCPSARRPDRHYADHIQQKRSVLASGYGFEQRANHSDARILADALWKFRHARELHVVRRQAQMALRGSIYIFLLVRDQHRHVVDAGRTWEVAKMHLSHQGDSDRLEPQARSAAEHAA